MSQDGSTLLDETTDVSGETDVVDAGGEAQDVDGADPGVAGTSDTATDASQPRDTAGRFKSRDAKRDLLSTESESGDEPSETATDATPGTIETSDATAQAGASEGAEGAPAGTTPAKPVYEKEPWSVTMDRESFPIEGAIRVKGHGVLIPEANAAAVEHLVSRGLRYNKQWREMREMQESLKAQVDAPSTETVEARALLAELKPLLNDAEAFADFMADPQGNLDGLLNRVDRAVLAAENERLKKGLETGREQVEAVDSEEMMATEFRSAFDRIATHELFRGKLPASELQAAYAKLQRYHTRFFRQADADMPEYGVKAGETILEQSVIVDELQDRLRLHEAANKAREDAKKEAEKLAAAQRRNDKITKPAARTAAVPVARRSTGAPAAGQPTRLSARDAKRDLLNEEYDSSL